MIFSPEAQEELQEAADYYEQRQSGLGDAFLTALDSGLHQIERSPYTWKRFRGVARRFLLKAFPYGIIYVPIDEEIYVLAVVHLKREPDYWLGRLSFLPPPREED